ncbi:hypothetical protein NQ176_g5408 [Zarea fungicola]|uniref:Uncharacterized protein n=1 Tax=Zarea fungicola TaxID=93591 RepID=A0ACC1NA24_9HYPO|nr:hypothetical protein NQ176_g5408 [Lecanicillium fungicola]
MALTEDEDDALVAYVQWMERTGMPATTEQVGAVANTLRMRRNPNASPASARWLANWRENHPAIAKTCLKAVERARVSFEAQKQEEVEMFYSRLQDIVNRYEIGASEIWNEDEAGIRIGCLRERVQVLVIRTTRVKSMRTQWEIPSLPGLFSSTSLPPTGPEIDPLTGVRFARSPTGFSNAEIHLEWARHFNRWSRASSSQAKRAGKSLEEWFGCDEHLRLPDQGRSCVTAPPNKIPEDEKIYRLLVVDGFTGHTTLDFAKYCIQFDIIIAILPPHSTHIMQPLDVGVFQPLKSAHQKELRTALAHGNISFTRVDLLASFRDIIRKKGLFPVDATPTITKIVHEQLRLQQPINPAYSSLLPSETRFQVAADALNDIRQRYGALLSSPSREKLRIATKAFANRKKRGKIVRPSGELLTSFSMEDINREQDELMARQTKQQRRQELMMHRSRVRGEMQKIRDEYKMSKKQFINGRTKTLNFKPWLEHTKRDIEFFTLEQCHETITQELKDPRPEVFVHDLARENNTATAIRARAITRPRPLQDMSSLPGSDDSVCFTGIEPSQHAQCDTIDEGDLSLYEVQASIPSSPPLAAVDRAEDTQCPRPRTRAYDRIMERINDLRADRDDAPIYSHGRNAR